MNIEPTTTAQKILDRIGYWRLREYADASLCESTANGTALMFTFHDGCRKQCEIRSVDGLNFSILIEVFDAIAGKPVVDREVTGLHIDEVARQFEIMTELDLGLR